MADSDVRKFYQNTNVFITGATGFVGKTLIEKLLRDTEVNKIYILIREKRGKNIQERLSKMFENPLYDMLKEKNPTFQNKIQPIVGQCGEAQLGISEVNKKELIENINIIFHAAATVNFNENLKTAYDINVVGVKTMISIAKKIKNLKSMVFVSTAFSNCLKTTVIKEKVYDYPYEEIIEQLENTPKEALELVAPKIIGEWPNTYTFTKSLAEMLIKKEKNKLPIGIFRPSIIVASYKEPIAGWLDNVYALNGITLGFLTGFLRVNQAKSDAIVDMIPIDKAIAALIVSAKDICDQVKINSEVRVYNFISRNENPITYDILRLLNFTFGSPSVKAVWKPSGFWIQNRLLALILSFIVQIIPAFFLDAFAVLTGKKPQLVSLYRKVHKLSQSVTFFALRDWKFDNNNIQILWRSLNATDRDLFPFSLGELSWGLFAKTYLSGIKKYILKEDDSMLEKAFTKYERFCKAHMVLKMVTVLILSSIVNNVLYVLYSSLVG